jgi:8-oxo-dGTP diphosphatase
MGLIVVKGKKVLVGRRKGSHAAGLVSFPGGHLDWNETWEDCVLRELGEECGEDIKVRLRDLDSRKEFFVTNDIMPQYGKHYITLFMVADWVEGEAINREPDKCEGWDWISYEELANLSQHGECANWIPMEHITFFRDKIGI